MKITRDMTPSELAEAAELKKSIDAASKEWKTNAEVSFAIMPVTRQTYDEVSRNLSAAGRGQAFDRREDPPLLDMVGIALCRHTPPHDPGAAGPLVGHADTSLYVLQMAFERACHHLRAHGYGAEDERTADILYQFGRTLKA